MKRVQAPAGDYSAATWFGSQLVVQYEARQSREEPFIAYNQRLWLLDGEEGELEILPLPDHPDCDLNEFMDPIRLPDGRLQYALYCRRPEKQPGFIETALYLMAYDFKTGVAEPLLPYEMPSPVVGKGGYAWNPEMTTAIGSIVKGRSINEQLAWFYQDHWEYVELDMPLTYAPAWSPDGRQIAFIGAPKPGPRGISRLDATFNLYLMSANGDDPPPLVEGFHYPHEVIWSPDGRWLVLNASFGDEEELGLWLIEVASGTRELISYGRFRATDWAPDGPRLAVVQVSGDLVDPKTNVLLVDLQSLIER